MNNATTCTTTRTRRSQFFVVLVFAVLYVGGPAFAYMGSGSKIAPCQSRGEPCCCVKNVEAPVKTCCKRERAHKEESKPTKSCCKRQQSHEEESKPAKSCKCKVGSGEIPDQVPALPLDESTAVGDQVLGQWIRVHAELASSVLCGPASMHDPPRARDGTADTVPRLGQSAGIRFSSCASAWMLVVRGVAGYLAVLSVYRV